MGFIKSNSTLKIDDQAISYVSNSLGYNPGFGTGGVVVSTIGGGRVKRDFTRDDSTKKVEVRFKMTTTAENIAIATRWKENFDNNITSVIQIDEDVEENMCFTGDFNLDLQNEGTFDVLFEQGS